jgi:hypothetical protein
MTRKVTATATALRSRFDELLATAHSDLTIDQLDDFFTYARRQINSASDMAAWSRPAPVTRRDDAFADLGYRRG